jgi:hypothetical protein
MSPETSPAVPTPADQPRADGSASPAKRRSNGFFRQKRPPISRDDARRQGDISQLAFLTMGGRDPAIAFLNAENAELGGRPLSLATASAEGYEQVAAAIRAGARGPDFE